MPKIKRKHGPPTTEDKKFIADNIGTMTITEIADKLRRGEDAIKNAAKRMGLLIETEVGVAVKSGDITKLEDELVNSPNWKILQNEFVPDELDYFKYQYCKYMSQFDNDVLASERTQIMQSVKLEILMQRNLSITKKVTDEILKESERLNDLYVELQTAKIKRLDTTILQDQINQCGEILNGCRSGQSARAKDLLALQDKHSDLMKELKATREQRISNVESAHKNFIGLIKALEDDDFRKNEGREMELFKLATAQEYNNLAEPHKFANNELDQPLLTPETVVSHGG